MTLGEQKKAVYSLERAFLIARRGDKTPLQDVVGFFIGDTDPGNFSIFEKQSLCFSILLSFNFSNFFW